MSIQALQEYIRISKYARYIPEKGRRETWEEQVNRVFEMHERKFGSTLDSIREEFEFTKKMVMQKRILGSQRALQFGGDPILTKNSRLYNCSASYCDRPKFFQESMYMLLCGCGIGFSVQKHHIEKLPTIKNRLTDVSEYVIPDSIEGWSDAIGVLMSSYFCGTVPFPEYQGKVVNFNYSQIRPAGSPISSGSKAPGPDGLRLALNNIEKLLERALKLGNKLRTIDCYDIIMYASDAVLSGGVRRSATLCIFSPEDDDMINAKVGPWMRDNPQRGRSNNSALLIREETTKETFSKLMQSVKEYGEPGFIWSDNKETLFNPCVTKDTMITTDRGVKSVADLIGKKFIAIVDGKAYPSTDMGFFYTGNKPIYEITTKEGYTVKATENHKFLVMNGTNKIWKELSDISIGDKIIINNHNNIEWDGHGSKEEGWLLGSLYGDGTLCKSKNTAYLDYWGDSRFDMQEYAIKCLNRADLIGSHNITGGDQIARVGKKRLGSSKLYALANEYGISDSGKYITNDMIETASSEFTAGFMRGWFDADGSVQGNHIKGSSIRLSSVNINELHIAQRILNRLGIYSKIYTNRRREGYNKMPNGIGGLKNYYCKATNELVISNHSMSVFRDRIGFTEQSKINRLNTVLNNYKRKMNADKFTARLTSKTLVGNEDVYDCTINTIHAFDANNFYAHNCCEISFYNYDDNDKSGWGVCNLTEINGKKCKTKEEFYECCRAASILGTMQAAYNTFSYLGKVSENIIKRDALLGVSITGMMDNPDIIFNPTIQKHGAKIILDENERIAKLIGVNVCTRSSCIKPSGTASCILGTSSGIHPHHARRYFRRVQANILEEPLKYFTKFNPTAVESSAYNNTDNVITFLCEVPDGAKTKNSVDAITLLETVKLTQQNWVEAGTRHEKNTKTSWLRHNVSNTINVKDDEWDIVETYIYKNRKWFAGISILPMSGDKDYPQAPFTAIYTPHELVREYGDASVFASGLIVAANEAYEDNLWAACDCALGFGEIIDVDTLREKIRNDTATNGVKWKNEGLSPDSPEKLLRAWLRDDVKKYYDKINWVKRAKRFADKYFSGDVKKMTYCLKDVQNLKVWCDLKREYVDIDWSNFYEQEYSSKDFGGAGEACSGGTCDLLGMTQHLEKDRERLKSK